MEKKHKGIVGGLVGLLMVAGLMGSISDTVTTSVVSDAAAGAIETAASSGDGGGSTKCVTSSDDDGGDDSGGEANANENSRKVAEAFAAAGYSKTSTAAAMGNLQAENSLFDPTVVNSIGATGLAQWYPGSKIQDWLDSHGHSDMDMYSLDAQILMLTDSVAKGEGWNDVFLNAFEGEGYTAANGNAGLRLYNTWRDSSDPKAAAVAWMDGFERPGHTSSEAQK